ncbi:hypothetical protein [Streptomyces sp. LUP30]|uniref:hypothetical protein n=1 Tax=Streptomyces sp. LUP30 TaxID=1890285 RepID=UPI00085181F7|nr:hypothetical protein [Streptomyces sp. LUP30]
MTYHSLRKRAPEPEPEAAVEEEPGGEKQAESGTDETSPAARGGGLWAGISGPGLWLAAHGRTDLAWSLYVGSVWAIGFYGGWIAAGIVIAWLLTVGLFTPKEYLDRLATAIERRFSGPAQKPPTAPPSSGGEAIRGLLLDLIGEGRGVHLRTVLDHLQEHGQWEGKEVSDLRRHLEALGIPVRPKVKVGGTPTRGVLKADLEALPPIEETSPSPAPSPAV